MIGHIITAALALGTVGGAFFYGQHVGVQGEKAKQADIEETRRETEAAAQRGAAAAIAKIKVQNTTIKQELEREIETHVVYRDCRVPADGVRLANEAITGRKQAESPGGGQLPRDSADGTSR